MTANASAARLATGRLAIALLLPTTLFAQELWPLPCPVSGQYSNWSETRCPATQSCSPNGFSAGGGYGCCPFPNGVSCGSGFACCPSGSSCTLISGTGYSTVYECTGANPQTTSKCPCKPGMPNPPSTTLKNVLVIGDSLSIGFTPPVAANLSDIALVQHAPWDISDGGAEESAYFQQCLDNWLHSPSGIAFFPDLIYFNSGMHNLSPTGLPGNGTVPGQSGNATEYADQMLDVMTRLVAFSKASGGKTKLMYGLTTAYLCDASVDAVITQKLNSVAASIAVNLGIWVVDAHSPIVTKCGAAPVQQCFGEKGCFCPHCPPAYQWLSDTVIAPAIRAILNDSS